MDRNSTLNKWRIGVRTPTPTSLPIELCSKGS